MTSVAYKDGILASDTLVTSGRSGIKCDTGSKVVAVRVKGGVMGFGFAGSAFAYAACASRLSEAKDWDLTYVEADWYLSQFLGSGCMGTNEDNGCSGLCVMPDGKVYDITYDSKAPSPVGRKYHAIGSGADLCLGAMAAGASAIDAVNISKELSVYSGGDTTWINLRLPDVD